MGFLFIVRYVKCCLSRMCRNTHTHTHTYLWLYQKSPKISVFHCQDVDLFHILITSLNLYQILCSQLDISSKPLKKTAQKRKVITCTGADGLFANDVAQQVILVESRTIRSHRNRFLIIRCPDVDNLVVGVGILERQTTAVLVYSNQKFNLQTIAMLFWYP